MKKVFIKSSIHGDLYFRSIYDYFDGPKLFSVISSRGKFLLVYWIDEDDDDYTWVAIDITKSRLLALERKALDIYSALNEKEDKTYFKILTPFDKRKPATIETIVGDISSEIIMPDRGIHISMVENHLAEVEFNEIIEAGILHADYSLHIDRPKASRSLIDFTSIAPIFDTLNELLNDFISSFKIHDKLLPVSGKPGSFIVDFNSSKFNLIEGNLKELTNRMKMRVAIGSFIKEKKIPLQALEKLFTHISNKNLIIDLSNKNSEDEFLKISKLDADFYLKEINRLSSLDLSSWQVPQADTLTRVFSLVENIWKNGFLDRVATGLSDRHIAYYEDAANILGFISDSGTVTSIGQQMILASDDAKLSITAKCFENSHCGWTWIMWSEVENISQVNPDTAKKFLDECAVTLSETTKQRRSRTLKTWCNYLQEHYKNWG